MTDLVLFSKLLHSVGLEQMANSRINHHTDGMDYLCLLRTPKLTVKLYCIRNTAKNANSGYLVHPHNHRYGFTSVLLSGELEHIRFEPKAVPDTGDSSLAYSKWIYHADTKNSAISERDTSMILQEKV